MVEAACQEKLPDLRIVEPDHGARCIKAEQVLAQAVALAGDAAPRMEAPDVEAPVLKLTGVNASYGPIVAVHDINLEIAPRECLALVGESGSGKTTLARSIAGLHKQRDGEILLDGAPLEQSARSRSPRGAAIDPVRLPEPVRLAQSPPHGRSESVRQPLELFGADGPRDRAPGRTRCSSASR